MSGTARQQHREYVSAIPTACFWVICPCRCQLIANPHRFEAGGPVIFCRRPLTRLAENCAVASHKPDKTGIVRIFRAVIVLIFEDGGARIASWLGEGLFFS